MTIDRKAIYDKFDGCCAYCGDKISIEQMQVDHFIPKRNGGSNEMSNLYPSCAACNRWKKTFTIEEFRAEIKAQVERLRRDSAAFRMAERYMLIGELDIPVIFLFEMDTE